MVLEDGKVHRVGTSVTPVDTLGAGDSLIGRFLAGIIAGEEACDALEAANAVAAKTCLHNGAFGYVHPYGSDAVHDGHAWPLVFNRHAHPDRTAHVPAPSRGASGA
jgi:hypothetical protein